MSLQKCANDMSAHTEGWSLDVSAKEGAENWLKDCIGDDFDIANYILDQSHTTIHNEGSLPYSMSLAQHCEYSC